jgi:hypothetical protein
MISTSIHGPAVDAFMPAINRVGDAAVGFDLRQLAPSVLDYPADVVLDAGVLAALAWQYDVDIEGLDQGGAVSVIKGAIALYRRGGTPWAIKQAMRNLGFDSVAITEGFIASVLHDGSWVRSGTYTHGGVYSNWSDFKVALICRFGFDGKRVFEDIEKSKNSRSRLTGVSVLVLISGPFIKFTKDIVTTGVYHRVGEGTDLLTMVPFDLDVDSKTLNVEIGAQFDAHEVTLLCGWDINGTLCGQTNFGSDISVPIRRNGCKTMIKVQL